MKFTVQRDKFAFQTLPQHHTLSHTQTTECKGRQGVHRAVAASKHLSGHSNWHWSGSCTTPTRVRTPSTHRSGSRNAPRCDVERRARRFCHPYMGRLLLRREGVSLRDLPDPGGVAVAERCRGSGGK